MPDRVRGQDLSLRVDIESTAGPVTVTVYDAVDDEAGSGTATLTAGGWEATVPVTGEHPDGLWRAVWESSEGETVQEFTVGEPGYLAAHVVRSRVVTRVAKVVFGAVSLHSDTKVVDNTLYGGGNEYVGYWFIPSGNSALAGIPRRVVASSGTALTLSAPYPVILPEGTRYELVAGISPFELDDAIAESISALRMKDRSTLHARALPVAEFYEGPRQGDVAIPNGWDYVSEVYLTNPEKLTRKLDADEWEMVPGRRVRVSCIQEDGLVDLIGARNARVPVWNDSEVDINPALLIPAATHRLHTARAGGSSTDPDEHMRQTVMAYQEFEDAERRFRRRFPNNQRKVIL